MSVKGLLRRPSATQDFFIGVATQHWRAGLKSPAAFQALTLALACWAKISGGLPGLHPRTDVIVNVYNVRGPSVFIISASSDSCGNRRLVPDLAAPTLRWLSKSRACRRRRRKCPRRCRPTGLVLAPECGGRR